MSQTEVRTLDETAGGGKEHAGNGRRTSTHAALLFPELIWKHYCWQHALHPERSAKTRNGRERANGDVAGLYRSYRRALDQFEDTAGEIVDAYWCLTDASAVVLTRKTISRWPRLRGKHDFRLYRATDWVTGSAPRIAALLHYSDSLAMKANQVLASVPKRITLNWIFSEQSFLLGIIERSAGKPTEKDLDSLVKEHAHELKRIERYYDRAASKSARLVYFVGMLFGLFLLAALGPGISGILHLFTDLSLHSPQTQNFFGAYGAGAVGAIVSVMLRMRPDNRIGFSVDYEVGRVPLFWLGAFRPVIGAVFGSIFYFALQSHVVAFGNQAQQESFYFYTFVGFLAGFSERFTQVIFGQAELTVTPALGSPPPGKDKVDEDAEQPVEGSEAEVER
jgi:hypothetical protein